MIQPFKCLLNLSLIFFLVSGDSPKNRRFSFTYAKYRFASPTTDIRQLLASLLITAIPLRIASVRRKIVRKQFIIRLCSKYGCDKAFHAAPVSGSPPSLKILSCRSLTCIAPLALITGVMFFNRLTSRFAMGVAGSVNLSMMVFYQTPIAILWVS